MNLGYTDAQFWKWRCVYESGGDSSKTQEAINQLAELVKTNKMYLATMLEWPVARDPNFWRVMVFGKSLLEIEGEFDDQVASAIVEGLGETGNRPFELTVSKGSSAWMQEKVKEAGLASAVIVNGGARTFEGHRDYVWAVAVSPDGKTVYSGSNDKTVKAWDAGTGACLRTFEGHRHIVLAVAVSPNGRTVYSGSADETFEGHRLMVLAVAVSPNGRTVYSGSADDTVMAWDAGTGACLRTFEGHNVSVFAVAVSPDGKTVYSVSRDKTVKAWDAGTGACLRTFEWHGDSVWAVAVSPDGKTVYSGSWDKTVKAWNVVKLSKP
ncbi:hypothetical protein HK102_003303 [Quaeritorhiza haematococci]|nr:hypothetical protein HK102_003303 [Quaeritorhiza haematococci]